jgi:hypothetical protein
MASAVAFPDRDKALADPHVNPSSVDANAKIVSIVKAPLGW